MSLHVLLIEDEPNIAEAMRFLLTREGFRVSHLADGTAALAQVDRDPPDLVILDHMLPGMSGLDILQALRADPKTQALPVMMLTARGRDRDLAAMLTLHHGFRGLLDDVFGPALARERIDGAYDKMIVRMGGLEQMPLRLLSPYQGFDEEEYQACRRVFLEKWADWQ